MRLSETWDDLDALAFLQIDDFDGIVAQCSHKQALIVDIHTSGRFVLGCRAGQRLRLAARAHFAARRPRTRMKTGLLSFAEYGDKMWGKLQPAAGLRPAYHRFLRVSQAGLKSRAG